MPALVDLICQATVIDSEQVGQQGYRSRRRWSPAQTTGKREDITLTASAFTALTVPTGAKMLILILGGATSLTLKGVTADTGIALVPTTNPLNIDLLMPLGASPSLGIANGLGSNQTVTAIWL